MKKEIRMAIVLTCHNRKAKTVNCITKLIQASRASRNYRITTRLFVCDDMSTDGTAEALERFGDDVAIIQGTGDLFWARGMARAMTEAEKWNSDFYLMVNDDVDFYDNVLDVMMDSYFSVSSQGLCAVVGSTKDQNDNSYTYGGRIWSGPRIHEYSEMVKPNGLCQECNQANWNCFLLPKELYNEIGKIDTSYEHSLADFDYSNRIIKLKHKIYVATDYIGYCSRNSAVGTWWDSSLPLTERLKRMNKRTANPPKSNWHYARKYYGLLAGYKFIQPYLYVIKTSLFK